MKKLLMLPMLLVAVLSFAAPKTTSPDWVIAINENGVYLLDAGDPCNLTIMVNTDEFQGIADFGNVFC
jgi:hypothetical protein